MSGIERRSTRSGDIAGEGRILGKSHTLNEKDAEDIRAMVRENAELKKRLADFEADASRGDGVVIEADREEIVPRIIYGARGSGVYHTKSCSKVNTTIASSAGRRLCLTCAKRDAKSGSAVVSMVTRKYTISGTEGFDGYKVTEYGKKLHGATCRFVTDEEGSPLPGVRAATPAQITKFDLCATCGGC